MQWGQSGNTRRFVLDNIHTWQQLLWGQSEGIIAEIVPASHRKKLGDVSNPKHLGEGDGWVDRAWSYEKKKDKGMVCNNAA